LCTRANMTNNPANITGVLTHTNVESGLVCYPKQKLVLPKIVFFSMAAKLLVPTSMVYYRKTAT